MIRTRSLAIGLVPAGVSVATGTDDPQRPDPIVTWSEAAASAAAAGGMAPLRTPISVALVHLAMYDATNAIDGDRRPYLFAPPVRRPASARAAAIEAHSRPSRMA